MARYGGSAATDWIASNASSIATLSKWLYTDSSTAGTINYWDWSTADVTSIYDTVRYHISGVRPAAVSAQPHLVTPPPGFNRYVNASDLLEEFLAWLKTERVRSREALALPIDLFIKWLIIRACEEEQQPPNVTLQLPPPRQQPRCLGCGQFMRLDARVAFHSAVCASWYFARQARSANLTHSAPSDMLRT